MPQFAIQKPVGFIRPEDTGAKGDWDGSTGTDDHAAFSRAVASAISLGTTLRLSPGKSYYISEAIAVENVRNLEVWGKARIIFPSDDSSLTQTDTEHSAAQRRSGFYFRNTVDCTIRDVRFFGTGTDCQTNLGAGVYGRRSVGLRVENCQHEGGGSLFLQDAVADTSAGSGNKTIALSGSTVTLTDANASFHAAMVGLPIFLAGCSNLTNDGHYIVTAVSSSTVLQYINAAAVGETSAFRYTVHDGDRKATIASCYSRNPHGYISAGALDTTFIDCHVEYSLDHADAAGVGDRFVMSGTTVTLTDNGGRFKPSHHKRPITIASASSGGNNGTFLLTYISSTQVSYTNASGVTENFSGKWWIAAGEKVGVGVGTSGIAKQTTTTSIQITASTGTYHRTSGSWISDGFTAGGIIETTGFSNSGNNAKRIIATITATDITVTSTTGLVNETATATAWTDLMLVTAASAVFSASDVGKAMRLWQATTADNNGTLAIEQFISSTVVAVHNAVGVSEDFSGYFTIDGWDNTTDSASNTRGSTQAYYIFAGRNSVKWIGGSITGARHGGIKVSGTSTPIGDVTVQGMTFRECNTPFLFGADDVNDHSVCRFMDNTLIDCGTQRTSWAGSLGGILGARSVVITGNSVHFTRDHIGSLDGSNNIGNMTGFSVSRYVSNTSQPLEDLVITDNKFTVDSSATTAERQMQTAISIVEAGQRNKYNTGATLTKQSTTVSTTIAASAGTATRASGSWISDGYAQGQTVTMSGFTNGGNNTSKVIASLTATVLTFTSNAGLVNETHSATTTNNVITLTDASALFSPSQDVGKTVQIVNSATSGNNSSFVVESATSTTLKYTNASGATGSGTYRLASRVNSASVVVARNQIHNCATVGISFQRCVAPDVYDNIFQGLQSNVRFNGDVTPRFHHNREISRNTLQGTIRIDVGTSWPIIHDNFVTNPALGVSFNRDMGVSVGNSTPVDYPLLGKQGKVRPTGAQEEIVFAYGSGHCDGDTVVVDFASTTYTFTYKTTSPGANQFNTFNTDNGTHTGLVGLIAGIANLTADDYGTGFSSGDVATQHIRVRRTATSTTDGNLKLTSTALNPTALVVLRNDTSPNDHCKSRGSGSAGPLADKTVIWSPLCAWVGVATLIADNSDARKVLGAGSAASGSIQCVTKANHVDGETVTIGDGINPAVVYEFDVAGDGVTAGHVQVNISGSTTAADVSAVLRPLISANQPGLTVADGGSGLITLTHNWYGPGGNVTLTETVANGGFTVSGLSGGDYGGHRHVKNSVDAGCCDVMKHAPITGSPEFRYYLAGD